MATAMCKGRYSKRDVLKLSATLIASAAFAKGVKAATPETGPVTPTLIEAARREGKVAWYCGALDLN